MTKLHEVLAAEGTVVSAWKTLTESTAEKFSKPGHYFSGRVKSLKMLIDSPANQAIEDTAKEQTPLVTNVYDTMAYALEVFANAENLQFQKNKTNQTATADLEFRGSVLIANLPVDQLLGLEDRLPKLRNALISAMPTLDASINWTWDKANQRYVSPEIYTTKTDKIMTAVELSPATKEHKAQVKEVTKDEVIGKFTEVKFSGSITSLQKANAIKVIDELILEIKKARMRANEAVVTETDKIGSKIADVILEQIKHPT